jgi:hypothetical protein
MQLAQDKTQWRYSVMNSATVRVTELLSKCVLRKKNKAYCRKHKDIQTTQSEFEISRQRFDKLKTINLLLIALQYRYVLSEQPQRCDPRPSGI